MGARIGLFGTFDLENFGDVLYPRILRRELERRLPGAEVLPFSPFGYPGLNRFDDGEESPAPLGAWSLGRAAEIAAEIDVLVIGGGEIVHDRDDLLASHYGVEKDEMLALAPSRFFIEGFGPELETEVPTIWHAVGIPFEPTAEMGARFRSALGERALVSVRDGGSERRLRSAGVDREVEIVPDSAFLVQRLFEPASLERRVAFLRRMGWYPSTGRALVVQGNRELIPRVDDLAGALHRLLRDRDDLWVVPVETGPIHGDGVFADVLAGALPPDRVYRIGAPAGLVDVTAAIAGSAGLVGSSLHGNIVALAFDRPQVIVNAEGQPKLDGFAELVAGPHCLVNDPAEVDDAFRRVEAAGSRAHALDALRRRVDAHLDRIAEIASAVAPKQGPIARSAVVRPPSAPPDRLSLIRTAYDAMARRMAAQQSAFADRLQGQREDQAEVERVLTEREEELRRAREEALWLRGVIEDRDRELEAIRGSRTFRWSARVRGVAGRFHRHRDAR